MPAKILSAALVGLEAAPVEIESDVANGLPNFTIVGLPDAAVQESRERVRTAMKNGGLEFPRTRLTVNLAPADLKKVGPAFDLPIALSIMVAMGEAKHEAVRGALFLGELALDGTVRSVDGVLSAALLAKELGSVRIYVPAANLEEAGLVSGVEARGVPSLPLLFEHLRDGRELPRPQGMTTPPPRPSGAYDLSAIAGLTQAKRAIEIAAAGGHNILLAGSPGAGKTFLARALPSILPPLSREEALEVAKIYSAAGLLPRGAPLMRERPWRAPHHSASAAAVVGGGTHPRPGEVTLAHRGVLFLDEFPEFPRPVIEGLRQPIEDREVSVSRSSGRLRFPADFMLVAAMNPCPCGYHGDPERSCRCAPAALDRYRKKISGPILDRIDLHVEVPRTPYEAIEASSEGEPSSTVRARVEAARARQADRGFAANADIPARLLHERCPLPPEGAALLRQASRTLHLSPRALHRSIRVARTIADLAGRDDIAAGDVAEALQFRPKQE